ncbi:MAG TPA: hypothetical protein VJ692_05160 [Nitrospiraceae bacterium]|nr:hypothetical protein [Nitrospiraceae bacterium]
MITPDFFELDFLDVETKDSGDAIALRYCVHGATKIHVVDGGYEETGERLVELIARYYGANIFVDNVVVTHQDGDHTKGLEILLRSFPIGRLWMHRPWIYADGLLPYFKHYDSGQALRSVLRRRYANIARLEELAVLLNIAISEPFQGATIGAFTVTAPTPTRYFELLIQSDKTPVPVPGFNAQRSIGDILIEEARRRGQSAGWGAENPSSEGQSCENEMSVVQFGNLCGRKILLTGDVGVAGLIETHQFCRANRMMVEPGIDYFQVPHHGGRRNWNPAILDCLLGAKLPLPPNNATKFCAIVSSAKADRDHPRKATVRAMIHRGGRVLTTEGSALRIQNSAPARPYGEYGPATILPYPSTQET